MSFVLRAAFWLTVMAFLLPAAGYESTPQPAAFDGGYSNAAYTGGTPALPPADDIGAGEALAIAARSAQDVMGFCGRNPDICEKSHAIVGHVVRQTTHYGSLAVVWLTEKAKERQEDSTEALGPRTVARPSAAPEFTAGA
ncbi:MAG: DUF5330 domain-containing protein [Parvibaculum sp.]